MRYTITAFVATLLFTSPTAFAAGEYDGAYDLEFSETHIVVNCGFSNFAGDLALEMPLYVVVEKDGRFPEEVTNSLLEQTYAQIEAFGFEGYPERRALEFADTFYSELQKALDTQLAAYPDVMTIALNPDLELPTPYLYVFDGTLDDLDTGWAANPQGAMRTFVGAYGFEPVLDYDFEIAFDTTALGVSVGIQLGGILDEQTGVAHWAVRTLALNTFTELILGCSASSVAVHSVLPEGYVPEPTPAPEPTPEAETPAPEPTPAPDASSKSLERFDWSSISQNHDLPSPQALAEQGIYIAPKVRQQVNALSDALDVRDATTR